LGGPLEWESPQVAWSQKKIIFSFSLWSDLSFDEGFPLKKEKEKKFVEGLIKPLKHLSL
jgi:hypothetical protein